MLSELKDVRVVFPFSAMVNQEMLKLALILNAINWRIGGLLIKGEKGTGKSLAVRGLVNILPEVEYVEGCPFNCNPRDPSNMCQVCRSRYDRGEALPTARRKMRIVNVPLGVTEDRLIGSLSLEKAIREGVRALQPGLLADANQGILYVDEVNLLPDHIVDSILDAAASGWNIVEREAISVAHPSRFILVGTMNPEEGELRPQLLDRLPLSVNVQGVMDEAQRAEIILRNLEFEQSPLAFVKNYEKEEEELRQRIRRARELLPKVKITQSLITLVAKLCISLQVDGQRPDIVIVKTAKTIAAFEGRGFVEPEDIRKASILALGHRTRRGGFEGPASSQQISEALDKVWSSIAVKYEMEMIRAGVERPLKPRRIEAESLRRAEVPHQQPGGVKPEEKYLPKKAFGGVLAKTFRRSWQFRKPTGKEGFEKYAPKGRGKASILLPIAYLKEFKLKEGVSILLQKLLDGAKKTFSLGSEVQTLRGKPSPSLGLRPRKGLEGALYKLRRHRLRDGVKLFRKILAAPPSLGIGKGILKARLTLKHRRFLVGKRAPTVTTRERGRCIGYEAPRTPSIHLALIPTLQAAAPYQKGRPGPLAVNIEPSDIRTKIREYRAPATIMLIIDVSGSMIDYLDAVSMAVMAINQDAYRKRDRVGVIAFRGASAYIVAHPTTNLSVVARKIKRLKAGGFTPLASGLMKGREVLIQEKRRNKDVIPLIMLISDCEANVPLNYPGKLTTAVMMSGIRTQAEADAIMVAKLLALNKIPVVVISPEGFPPIPAERRHPSTLGMKIAEITKGSYHVMPPLPSGFEAFKLFMKRQTSLVIAQQIADKLMEGVTSVEYKR